eukprot:814229-Rhodomonas_salina.1
MDVNGTLTFEQHQETAEIIIPIIDVEGHNAVELSFQVTLFNPKNATLSKANALVTIQEVQAPAPDAPFQDTSATASSLLTLVWNPLNWAGVPETAPELAYVEAYAVRAKRTDNSTSSWETLDGSASLNSDDNWELRVEQLPTYSSWIFQVAARTSEGWTAWSASSAVMRTKAVCGDGRRQGAEQCDVGAGEDTAGCQSCVTLAGYSCQGMAPDVCEAGCGDGTRVNAEECDDGNNATNDGCSELCRLEEGWTCDLDANGQTTNCTTTCNDGIKAGTEACDSGSLNGQGHGCAANCTMTAGAVCVADEAGLSVCQVCGNGALEGDEVCDDGDTTDGCVACAAVRDGWRCTGGDFATADTCTAGPDTPDAPTGGGITADSITFEWRAPSGNGKAVVNYTLVYFNPEAPSHTNASVVSGRQVTLSGLSSDTQYQARLNACSMVGCSSYSVNSLIYTTSAVSAYSEFANLADSLVSDPTRLVDGLNASITQIELETPDEPAPEPAANDALLNSSQYEDYLASLNGSDPELEGTPQPTAAPEVQDYLGQPKIGFRSASVFTNNGNPSFTVPLSFANPDANGGVFVQTIAAGGVHFEVREYTARRGVDFNISNGTVNFASGATGA